MKTYELVNNETTPLPIGAVLYELPENELTSTEKALIEKEKHRDPIPCRTIEGIRQLIPYEHLQEI